MVDSRLKETMISRVAAATVKLIEFSSMRYIALGITAIGHREQTELVMYGEWSEDQIKNSHESLSTSISSPHFSSGHEFPNKIESKMYYSLKVLGLQKNSKASSEQTSCNIECTPMNLPRVVGLLKLDDLDIRVSYLPSMSAMRRHHLPKRSETLRTSGFSP